MSFTLHDIAVKVVPIMEKVRLLPKTRAKLMIFGSLISLVGFVLPWSSIVFDPPGHSLVVNGQTLGIYSVDRNGFQQADFDASIGNNTSALIIHGILGTLFLMFAIGFIIRAVILFSPYARTFGVVKVLQPVLHLLAAATYLWNFFHSSRLIIKKDMIDALGGWANTLKVLHFTTSYVDFGFYIVVLGFAIAGIGVITSETTKAQLQTRITSSYLEKNSAEKGSFVVGMILLAIIISISVLLKATGAYDVVPIFKPIWATIWGAIKPLF